MTALRGIRGRTLSQRLAPRRPRRAPWSGGMSWGARIGLLVAAVAAITVATGGTAATVAARRRGTPPRPADRPPRVDDPLR